MNTRRTFLGSVAASIAGLLWRPRNPIRIADVMTRDCTGQQIAVFNAGERISAGQIVTIARTPDGFWKYETSSGAEAEVKCDWVCVGGQVTRG